MPAPSSSWTRPPWSTALLSVSLRLATFVALVLLPHVLPSWDPSSRSLLPPRSPAEGLLRWDTVHFVGIAERASGSHEEEKEWAFARGIVAVLRLWRTEGGLERMRERMVLGGSAVALSASIASGLVLYALTLRLTKDERFAHRVHLLHSLTPAPATLVVPYTEPFFGLFTFAGSLAHVYGARIAASFLWALATWFRPLGVLNAGFFVWDWLEDVGRYRRRKISAVRLLLAFARALALACVVAAPFVHSQREAYLEFCVSASPRPWCSRRLPLVYTWTQEHYWDVGFLRYWTFKQSPLFVLSAPTYALLVWTLYHFYSAAPPASFLPFPKPSTLSRSTPLIRHANLFAPHIHQTLFLTTVLLFHSHVQIVLRQISTMPVAWWGAATLVSRDLPPAAESKEVLGPLRSNTWIGDTWGQAWVRWCILWGLISIILWGVFLPPA